MAFDQSTRNRLARFVSDTRSLLVEEFTRQLQNDYGLDPNSGDATDLARLDHLDDARHETARILRDTMEHYLAFTDISTPAKAKKARQDVLLRIVREQAFTILNRLCALRMAEARGLLIESIAKGYQSKGFQLYQRLAGSALGETGACYRLFICNVFDEFAVDLPVLFDRFSPQGRLFPREAALLSVLQEINHPDIDPLWTEDETIGWIYQYFNSVEERRQMRAESQAPRNSRELAVRNQFFTPRYVVEFLTDNTLGRIWYEMTKGESSLKDSCRYLVRRPNEIFLAENEAVPKKDDTVEDLSQEELLNQPVHIPHRPLKDPRDIKMLDPACGSMHFGLYAFDLFERIYEESWDIEAQRGVDGFVRTEGLKPLHETYSGKTAFLRDVPRLIIEQNIHGIDIDPRAVQIAGLSLWLRAQRSWQAQNVKALDRPQIQCSNIVCAEPMPGEADMLDEFIDQLQPKVLGQLVKIIFEKMKLAGEAGSLLKIEEEIKDAVSTANEAYRKYLLEQKKDSEYLPGMAPEREKTLFDFAGLHEKDDFWNSVELRVMGALRDYSEEQAEYGAYQRRLFANDAAQGFAFIDICRKRYDVALMNPPFGLAPRIVFDIHKKIYAESYVELYAQMVTRGLNLLNRDGCLGAISSRSFMTISRLRQYRREMILEGISLLADLGASVMDDAFVESAAYIITKRPFKEMYGLDLRGEDNPQDILSHSIDLFSKCNPGSGWAIKDRQLIVSLPDCKILYSLPLRVHKLLSNNEVLEPDVATVRQGMGTFNDFRFLRLRHEIMPSSIGRDAWEPLAKGGAFAFYYSDIYLLLNWKYNGAELSAVNIAHNGQDAQVRQASEYWRKSGSTYSKRSQKGFSARALPAECIIAGKGPAILSQSRVSSEYLLGWVNSRFIRWIIEMQANDHEYNTGILKKIPWIENTSPCEVLINKTKMTIKKVQAARAVSEINSCFIPAINNSSLMQTIDDWHRINEEANLALTDALEDWDSFVDQLYGVDSRYMQLDDQDENPLENDEDDDGGENTSVINNGFGSDAVSILLGFSYGRWDIRTVIHPSLAPKLPDPFEKLPNCQPGVLQSTKGYPAEPLDVPSDYPLSIPWDGILVDDNNCNKDIVASVRKSIEVIWQLNAESTEQEICKMVSVVSLREYFRKITGFFSDHLKRYSKSRRVAPIYWPLSTPSGSYTLWLYYHRLTDQTLYTCVLDFVEPKLKQVSEDATSLRSKSNRSSVEEIELDRLSVLELELKDFRDELLRIASFWKPNLNDGVQITAAPLWNLFQHRQWKDRLKVTWEKLKEGEYDWAHLALSIWPDRVVSASHKDRSYAIAHDLEDQLWHEVEVEKVGRGGRVTMTTEWQPRDLSKEDLQRIVAKVKARCHQG